MYSVNELLPDAKLDLLIHVLEEPKFVQLIQLDP